MYELELTIRDIFSRYYVDIIALHNKVTHLPITTIDSIYKLVKAAMDTNNPKDGHLIVSTFVVDKVEGGYTIKHTSISDVNILVLPTGICIITRE